MIAGLRISSTWIVEDGFARRAGSEPKERIAKPRRHNQGYTCKACGQQGHSRRTCGRQSKH